MRYAPFTNHLIKLGMADTRASALADVIDKLHRSVGAMDLNNRKIMRENFPDLMEIVAVFGDHDHMLDNFRNTGE